MKFPVGHFIKLNWYRPIHRIRGAAIDRPHRQRLTQQAFKSLHRKVSIAGDRELGGDMCSLFTHIERFAKLIDNNKDSRKIYHVNHQCPQSDFEAAKRHFIAPPNKKMPPAVCTSVCMSVRPSVCLAVCLSVYLSVCLSVCLFLCFTVCLSVPDCLSVFLSVFLSVSLYFYVFLSVCVYFSKSLTVCLFVVCQTFCRSF